MLQYAYWNIPGILITEEAGNRNTERAKEENAWEL